MHKEDDRGGGNSCRIRVLRSGLVEKRLMVALVGNINNRNEVGGCLSWSDGGLICWDLMMIMVLVDDSIQWMGGYKWCVVDGFRLKWWYCDGNCNCWKPLKVTWVNINFLINDAWCNLTLYLIFARENDVNYFTKHEHEWCFIKGPLKIFS